MSPGKVTNSFLNGGGSSRSQHPPLPPSASLQIPQPPCKEGRTSVCTPFYRQENSAPPPNQQGLCAPCTVPLCSKDHKPCWAGGWRRQVGAKALEEGAVWTASCGGTGLRQTWGTQGGKADPEAHMEQGGVPRPREGRKPRMDSTSCPPSAWSSAQQVLKAPE